MQYDLHIEQIPLAQVLPYAANARTHSVEQVAQIKASIAEFGFINPVLVDATGTLIAGHGRVMAAKSLGLEFAPAIRLGHLTEAQARAFRLADNQIALNATWDLETLRGELLDLQTLGVNLELVGFAEGELAALLLGRGAGLTDPDDIPELQGEAVTLTGEAWVLGRHRLVCGDATVAGTVAIALNGVVPHLMVTDPPYGVHYDPSWRNRAGVSRSKRVGKVANDDRADWRAAWVLFPGSVAYVWHGGLHAGTVAESLEACGFEIRAQIIWAKESLVMSRGHYHWKHEPCWYAVKGSGQWTGDRKQTTLWQIASREQDAQTVHGTQKPVDCMRRPILNNSCPGQAVYEPFCGSGTTLIAAEMTGRVCHAIEIDPIYVDVAIRRWQAFTGQRATLVGDERAFDEIAEARLKVMT